MSAEAHRVAGSGTGTVYEYALLRVVPRIERGECLNAGVVLYCRPLSFVAARTRLDTGRLRALDPEADAEAVRAALKAAEAVCRGGAAAGRAAEDEPGRRFRWLVAPRSTVVQPGPVHTGLTTDPRSEIDRLFDRLVG
ncbi:DUF3037 domain-containing protein [Streptomyces sodiiphilus]|uniref:DUF3037 domain-containing protein n=1 Tax=Streptomyces sodiiphilus TaxID=226217 RepID=A0ABN2PRX0_9ACTN